MIVRLCIITSGPLLCVRIINQYQVKEELSDLRRTKGKNPDKKIALVY